MKLRKWPKTIRAVLFDETGEEKFTFVKTFDATHAVYRSTDEWLFLVDAELHVIRRMDKREVVA